MAAQGAVGQGLAAAVGSAGVVRRPHEPWRPPTCCALCCRCTDSRCGPARRPCPRGCASCCRSSSDGRGRGRARAPASPLPPRLQRVLHTRAPLRAEVHGSAQPALRPVPSCVDGGARKQFKKERLSLDCSRPAESGGSVDPGISFYRNQDSSVVKSTN